jgi:site-specific recombinase XerD
MKSVPKEIEAIEESIRRLLNNEPYSKTRIFRPLPQEQLEALKLFDRFNNLREVSLSSRRNYLFYLKSFALNVNKPFKDVTKEDIENYMLFLNKRAVATKNLSKVIIKKFFQWLYDFNKNKYPEIVDWIETGIKNSKKTLPENLLTYEEILKLTKSTDNLRDQAIILLLTEVGIRVGELTNLKVKDFEPQNDGTALIKVSGKTGERKIPLINSVNPLVLWFNTHPYRDDIEAPLFVNLSRNHYGERITRGSVEYMIQKVSKTAKINKRVYPHLFRHVSATRDSKDFSDALMRLKYGWSSNAMVEVYSHLTVKDLISKEKERAGIDGNEVEPDKVLNPINLCNTFRRAEYTKNNNAKYRRNGSRKPI